MDLEMIERQHRRNIFYKCDIDRDGKITFDELKDFIKGNEAEHLLPDQVVKEIFEKADHNKDGTLDFEEFNLMFMAKENAFVFMRFREIFRRYINHILTEGNRSHNAAAHDFWILAIVIIQILLVELILYYMDSIRKLDSTTISVRVTVIHIYIHLSWCKLAAEVYMRIIRMMRKSSLIPMFGLVVLLIATYFTALIISWTTSLNPVIKVCICLIFLCADVGLSTYFLYACNWDQFPLYRSMIRQLEVTEEEKIIIVILSSILYFGFLGTIIIYNGIQYILE